MWRPDARWRLIVAVVGGLAWRGGSARAADGACDVTRALRDRADARARAEACYAAKRVPEAIQIDRAMLAKWPEDDDVRLELARLLVEVDDLAAAQVEYDRLVAARPRDRARAKARADVLAWRGELDAAIAEYTRLITLAPDDASLRVGLGLAQRWAGRFEDAERTLAAVAPRDAEAAKALRELHASPAWTAIEAERALRAQPEDQARWVTAIDAVMRADRLDDAETLASQARQRWPLSPKVMMAARAVSDRKAGEAASRLKAARSAVARSPQDHEAARDLARVLSWNGRYRESLAHYDRLVAARPNDPGLRLERGRVRSWDGQLRAASEDYPRAHGVEAGGAERGMAEVHAWSGNLPVAGRHYAEVQRVAPGTPHAEAADAFFRRERDRWQFESGANVYSDSDDFRAIRSDVGVRKRFGLETDVSAHVGDREYAQLGESTRATRARVGVTQEVHDRVRVRATTGANVYADGTTTPIGEVGVDVRIDPESTVGLSFDHDDIVSDAQTGGSVMNNPTPVVGTPARRPGAVVADPIEGDRVQAYGAGVLPGRIEIRGLAQGAHYTDGNRMMALFAGVYRRIWRDPDIKIGAEGRYVSYADRADQVRLGTTDVQRYWHPRPYASGNAVVRAQKTIPGIGKVMLDGGVGYGNEEGAGVLESSAGARVEVAEIGRFMIDLFYRWGRTARTSGTGGTGYEFHTGGVALRWREEAR